MPRGKAHARPGLSRMSLANAGTTSFEARTDLRRDPIQPRITRPRQPTRRSAHCDIPQHSSSSIMPEATQPAPHSEPIAAARMTTAEATVAALIVHGIRDDLCAARRAQRPPVRCAVQGWRPHPHRSHPARAGRGLYGARSRARHRQAAGLCGGAGAGPAQFSRGIADRLWNECAGACADRPDFAGRHRPRAGSSA